MKERPFDGLFSQLLWSNKGLKPDRILLCVSGKPFGLVLIAVVFQEQDPEGKAEKDLTIPPMRFQKKRLLAVLSGQK